jgi:hypothetical protein
VDRGREITELEIPEVVSVPTPELFSQRAQGAQRPAFRVEVLALAHDAFPSTVPNDLNVRRGERCGWFCALCEKHQEGLTDAVL